MSAVITRLLGILETCCRQVLVSVTPIVVMSSLLDLQCPLICRGGVILVCLFGGQISLRIWSCSLLMLDLAQA